jgi:FtsH-binding integral membrane protein
MTLAIRIPLPQLLASMFVMLVFTGLFAVDFLKIRIFRHFDLH